MSTVQWPNSNDKIVQLISWFSSNAWMQCPSPHSAHPLLQAARMAFKPRCRGPWILKAWNWRLCPFATNDRDALALCPASCSKTMPHFQVGAHKVRNWWLRTYRCIRCVSQGPLGVEHLHVSHSLDLQGAIKRRSRTEAGLLSPKELSVGLIGKMCLVSDEAGLDLPVGKETNAGRRLQIASWGITTFGSVGRSWVQPWFYQPFACWR